MYGGFIVCVVLVANVSACLYGLFSKAGHHTFGFHVTMLTLSFIDSKSKEYCCSCVLSMLSIIHIFILSHKMLQKCKHLWDFGQNLEIHGIWGQSLTHEVTDQKVQFL